VSSLLRSCLLEVARLRPVTPLGVPHGTLADVRLGTDYLLPPGTMLLPLHWAINRDPAVWERPEEFDATRFLMSGGDLASKMLPFQSGRRRCIGADLGKSLVESLVAAILQEFDVELEAGFDPWHRPHHGFTLTPLPFKLRWRGYEISQKNRINLVLPREIS
jgi:ecdysteroid 25-hydroxylase CYP306A1